MSNKINVVMMKISDLHDYENNPRKNDKAVDAVASSINSLILPLAFQYLPRR